MSELPAPTVAHIGIARKNPEVQIPIASPEDSNRALDRRLDEALEDTFPASDAVSIVISVING
jgi:hypothetical protein